MPTGHLDRTSGLRINNFFSFQRVRDTSKKIKVFSGPDKMPVSNINDGRKNKVCVEVMAIFEACWHDNTVGGATQFKVTDLYDCMYFGIKKTTIELAIKYGNQRWPDLPVCLYVYDLGCKNSWDVRGLEIDPETGLVRTVGQRTKTLAGPPVENTGTSAQRQLEFTRRETRRRKIKIHFWSTTPY